MCGGIVLIIHTVRLSEYEAVKIVTFTSIIIA